MSLISDRERLTPSEKGQGKSGIPPTYKILIVDEDWFAKVVCRESAIESTRRVPVSQTETRPRRRRETAQASPETKQNLSEPDRVGPSGPQAQIRRSLSKLHRSTKKSEPAVPTG
jgi:hypothetical protein